MSTTSGQPIALVAGILKELQDQSDAATKAVPAGKAVIALLGGSPWYSGTQLRADLAAVKAKGQLPVVWLGADANMLASGTCNIPGLPTHPDTLDAVKAIRDHAADGSPVAVRVLFGFSNTRHLPDGTIGYRYGSAAKWVAAADAIAALLCPLDASGAALPTSIVLSWDLDEPGSFPVGHDPFNPAVFDPWKPTHPCFLLAGIDLFSPDDLNPTTKRGTVTHAFHDYAVARGMRTVHFEVCSTFIDILATTAWHDFFAPLLHKVATWGSLALCIENDPHNYTGALSGRYAPGPGYPLNHGIPDWTGNPDVCARLSDKYASMLFVKLQDIAASPLAAIASSVSVAGKV